MRGNNNDTADKMLYSKKLSSMLGELCISQSELGRAIGRSQKTISRYVLGETLPSEKTQSAIRKFIQEKSVYEGFVHIPSQKFSKLLKALFKEFKGEISQEGLAVRIGKYQKDISNYLHNAVKADTKTQYDILLVFYNLCRVNGGFVSFHTGTGMRLYELLDEYAQVCFPVDFGEQAGPRDFVQYCIELPYVQQKFILENFEAFHDNYLYALKPEEVFDFTAAASLMELFRQLSLPQQKSVAAELEKDAFVGFPDSEQAYRFFRHMAVYRKIISENLSNLNKDKHLITDNEERESFIKAYESCANLVVFEDDSDMIEEIKYKLTFTRYEWYIWMLMLIYSFKGKDLFLFVHKILEMQND